jgi:indole-3-glycerol phosphate synthase
VEKAAEAGLVTVAASGIRTRADVERAAQHGASAVLVGETLMRSEFPEDVLEALTGVRTIAPVNG